MTAMEGSAADISIVAGRMDLIRRQPDYYVMGGFGRWALQTALKWPKAKPLALRKEHYRSRDIDVFSPYRGSAGEPFTEDPFHIDLDMSVFFHPGRPPMVGHFENRTPLAHQALLTRFIRKIADIEIPTLSLGSHFLIEQLIAGSIRNRGGLDKRSHADMAEFTTWARPRHPKEFLAPKYYQPFIPLAQKLGRDLSPLMPK